MYRPEDAASERHVFMRIKIKMQRGENRMERNENDGGNASSEKFGVIRV